MAGNLFTFYQDVIENELRYTDYDEVCMNDAVDKLLASYSVQGLKMADSLDFNRKDLRCAYIHLYATSHSHMVMDALYQLLPERYSDILQLLMTANRHGSLNVTALGGGPGSDPLGFLTFLEKTGYLHSFPMINVTVVDKYRSWEQTCRTVMKRCNSSPVRVHFTNQDLLMPMSTEVERVLRSSHFLSMVKFISAIAGDKFRTILSLKKVFELLQPGTMVLLIDNAGGPDFKETLDVANIMGLEPVIKPLLHYEFKVPKYLEYNIDTPRFGKRAQTGSKISMAILKKCGYSALYATPLHLPIVNYNVPFYPQTAPPSRKKPSPARSAGGVAFSRNASGNSPSILDRLELARHKRSNVSQSVQPARSPSLACRTSTGANSSNVLPSSITSTNVNNILRNSHQPHSTHWAIPNRRVTPFYAQQMDRSFYWYLGMEVPDPFTQLVLMSLGIWIFHIVANGIINELRTFLSRQ